MVVLTARFTNIKWISNRVANIRHFFQYISHIWGENSRISNQYETRGQMANEYQTVALFSVRFVNIKWISNRIANIRHFYEYLAYWLIWQIFANIREYQTWRRISNEFQTMVLLFTKFANIKRISNRNANIWHFYEYLAYWLMWRICTNIKWISNLGSNIQWISNRGAIICQIYEYQMNI